MSSSFGQQTSDRVLVTHPNRDKAVVQGTRAIVILLLLVSVVLLLLITIGGAEVLVGASIGVQVGYVIVYLLLAFFAGRWNRGVLPVASASAVLLIIFALSAAPGWFDRDAAGFTQPSLNASLLGLLTLLLIPVQILLIAFAMRGFAQGWNVEIERLDSPAPGGYGDAAAHPA
jgi:presenilin-like A22 family membrane protease